jgi:hypothetical protein
MPKRASSKQIVFIVITAMATTAGQRSPTSHEAQKVGKNDIDVPTWTTQDGHKSPPSINAASSSLSTETNGPLQAADTRELA